MLMAVKDRRLDCVNAYQGEPNAEYLWLVTVEEFYRSSTDQPVLSSASAD
jgi:hypothetical protein